MRATDGPRPPRRRSDPAARPDPTPRPITEPRRPARTRPRARHEPGRQRATRPRHKIAAVGQCGPQTAPDLPQRRSPNPRRPARTRPRARHEPAPATNPAASGSPPTQDRRSGAMRPQTAPDLPQRRSPRPAARHGPARPQRRTPVRPRQAQERPIRPSPAPARPRRAGREGRRLGHTSGCSSTTCRIGDRWAAPFAERLRARQPRLARQPGHGSKRRSPTRSSPRSRPRARADDRRRPAGGRRDRARLRPAAHLTCRAAATRTRPAPPSGTHGWPRPIGHSVRSVAAR